MRGYLLIAVVAFLIAGCGDSNNAQSSVIPEPTQTSHASGSLALDSDLVIVIESQSEEVALIAEQLAEYLVQQTKLNVSIENKAIEGKLAIVLALNDFSRPKESYQVNITKNDIELIGQSEHGLFYGVQTFKQLLLDNPDLSFDAQTIEDSPAFNYRGMMLDVSRHFFTVEEIKRFLDVMAFYKLNKFHWHLTDDQGWRIEIKQYPLLTDIGAWRNETMLDKNFTPYIGDGVPHGGFYTQEEIKHIVDYAATLYIEVIPEIEMPGHAKSALAAYPELACDPKPIDVATTWGIHKDIMCPSAYTFEFVQNVLSEVIALFPSKYIHIGGDEVPTTRWEQSDLAQQVMVENNLANESALQGYFFDEVDHWLNERGKQSIGWDEILEKEISSRPIVMIWRDLALLGQANNKQLDVILTPRDYTYFDYYQGEHDNEPLAQCCMLTTEEVYKMPTQFEAYDNANIIGGQGQVWTAFINNESHLQYMTYPRMMALAEVLWRGENRGGWEGFNNRLNAHFPYLAQQNINFKAQ